MHYASEPYSAQGLHASQMHSGASGFQCDKLSNAVVRTQQIRISCNFIIEMFSNAHADQATYQ